MRPVFLALTALVVLAGRAEARVLPQARDAWHLLPVAAKAEPPALHLVTLDDGGGAPRMNYSRDKLVSILFAIVPGFGLGHFWLNDTNGFVTFLIVDAVVWTGLFLLPELIWFMRVPMIVVFVAAKVWQVLDVTRSGGGGGDAPGLPAAALRPARPEVRLELAAPGPQAFAVAF